MIGGVRREPESVRLVPCVKPGPSRLDEMIAKDSTIFKDCKQQMSELDDLGKKRRARNNRRSQPVAGKDMHVYEVRGHLFAFAR